MWRILASVLLVVALLPSVTSAQSSSAISGCQTCDPLEANEWQVRGAGQLVNIFLYAHVDRFWNGVINTEAPGPGERSLDVLGGPVLPALETDAGLYGTTIPTCADV